MRAHQYGDHSLTYGPNMTRTSARRTMNGGRSRQAFTPTGDVMTVQPARPRASIADRRFWAVASSTIIPGITHELHRGMWPMNTPCTCSCHGSGITDGSDCDDRRCVEVGERMPSR